MKRLSMTFMVALAVLAMSCKKNGNEDLTQGPGFRAAVETQTGDSKTHLVPNAGGGGVVWDANDAIMVLNGNNTAKEFTTNGEVTDGYAEFQSDAAESFYQGSYTAYYPSSIYTSPGRVTLPETQTYAENSFGKGFNPMVACATDETLEFRNLCGILALQLTGSCTVTSIRITAKGGEKLWGTGNVTMDGTGSAMTPTLGELTGGTSTLTLNCGTGVTLSGTATTFCFVLPAGALASGFDVLLTDSNDKVWKRSASAGHNTEIIRSNIKTMAELPVVPQDPITPDVNIAYHCSSYCATCSYTVDGEVYMDGAEPGTFPCEFGIVYSETDDTPTIEEGASKIIVHSFSDEAIHFYWTEEDGDLGADFTIDFAEFPEEKTYYVRVYAIIEGTSYSGTRTVFTEVPKPLPSNWVDGKNPHPFTVGPGADLEFGTPDDRKVYFSQGNLQYIGSAAVPYWKFADHQFDIFGLNQSDTDAANIDRDLFGFGTSGWDNGNVCYQPYSTSTVNDEYGPKDYSVPYDNIDWGVYCTIINGGSNSWRTLSYDVDDDYYSEWHNLIRERPNYKSLRREGKVVCTPGWFLLPDDWDWNKVSPKCKELWDHGSIEAAYNFMIYSYSEWSEMEAEGALFLPAAGVREGTIVYGFNDYEDDPVYHDVPYGVYWSTKLYEDYWGQGAQGANVFYFGDDSDGPFSIGSKLFWYGCSVRLVSDVAPTTK